MNRSYPNPCKPYVGLEGTSQAERDGKIWLNNIDLLLAMLTEYAVVQIREFAFQLAHESDPSAAPWPSILNEEPPQPGQWHDWQWWRRKNFLTIFSGRDDRFAYIPDNLPGAGLEKRMLKQAEAWWFSDCEKMAYFKNSSDLAYPDFDPNRWVAGYGGVANWNYPIDPADPASAPLLMRLLDCWLGDFDGWFHNFAEAVMETKFQNVFNGQSPDIPVFLEGCGGLDGKELNVGVHHVVCWMVETLGGLEGLKLNEITKPLHTNREIVAKVRLKTAPKIGDTAFPYINRWKASNMSIAGKSLQLYFIDGKPDGMLTAEVFNWTGHVLMTPRTQISKALTRPQSAHTGVYILLGDGDGGEPLAYIGEAENMAKRLGQHVSGKDWWTSAVLVTTASDVLNKAHVKYLEARLVETAYSIKRMKLENGNTPPRPSLTEADVANMEGFLDNLLMVLPALRIDMFVQHAKPKTAPASTTSSPRNPEDGVRFVLRNKKVNLTASARLEEGDFIVEQGSEARKEWVGGEGQTYVNLRKELEENGTLVPNGDKCVFAQDYAFKSPSAAAAMVQGRSANGTVEWKVQATSQSYKTWEQEQIDSSGIV